MNKIILIGAVVLALVAGGLGYQIGVQSGAAGATINYSNSLSQARLYNSFESLLADVTALRNVANNYNTSSSVTLTFPAIATGTVTSTALTGIGIGSPVQIAIVSSSAPAATLMVTAWGCGANTACIQILNTSSTSFAASQNVTFFLRGTATSSLNVPALGTTSSTSN